MSLMPLILSHKSALEFYRLSDEGYVASLPRIRNASALACAAPDASCASRLAGLGLELPISVLNNSSSRLTNSSHIAHKRFAASPPDAYLKLDDGLFACSPELVFLQLAGTLSVVELICLGYELCGFYPDEKNGRSGVLGRKPLTSVSRIRETLARCSGAYHVAKARRAASYVVDGSASPMEAALCMRLSLPYVLGGYGIPRPLLNRRIDFAAHVGSDLERSFCICDLLWLDAGLAAEYDSDLHATSQKIFKDADRRNALLALGIEVVTVTKGQMFSFDEFEKVAKVISRKLGHRIRPRCRDYRAKQAELIRAVLSGPVLQGDLR